MTESLNHSLNHFFTFHSSLGGVESVLQRHPERDRERGVHSRILAFFESRNDLPPAVHGLGWTGWTGIRRARASLAAWRSRNPVEFAVYHNTWGLPFLADLDGAARRVGIIHSDWPGQDRHLRNQAGMLDGLCCVSLPLVKQALTALPELGEDRVRWIPYPIRACPFPAPEWNPPGDRPLRVGLVGRLVKEQKRVDRIPPLLRRLRASGVAVELEILGDGALRPWLERQCAHDADRSGVRVRFRGRLSGAAYWKALSGWDAIVFVSDYEGLPISMLEAMSLGVLPFCPEVGSGGDDYARRVSPELVYPPGDLDALTGAVRRVAALPGERVRQLRTRARDLAAPHVGDEYYDVFAEFTGRIRAMPRVSRPEIARRARLLDFCPFGVLRRIRPEAFWES